MAVRSPTTGQESERRLFFALWPDIGVRRQIQSAPYPKLKPNTTPLEHWHLTLVFLGLTTSSQQRLFEGVADGIHAAQFELVLDITGMFARARVAWLGCSHPHAGLVKLQAELESGLRAACPDHPAFAERQRPFCPHVTLYRKVDKPMVPQKIRPVSWAVNRFNLVESRPAQRPVYRLLRSWELDAGKQPG